MNAYDDNPFFFFVDNPTFPMDVYPDIGKIIELSDTGCDARAPLTSNRRRNDHNRPYSAKTVYTDVLSFQDVFDEKEKHRDNQFNEIHDKQTKKVPARDRTVPRNSRRSRTIERDNNEEVDQWERNIADYKNTMLRDQVNLLDDSSIENILDHDPISENSRTYFSNSKNSLPRREINRKSRKEETNVKNEIRERIPDFAKNSNEMRSTRSVSREETSKGKRIASAARSTRVDRKKRRENFDENNNEKKNERTKDFVEKPRRSIDRAVDKDSLSDNSGMSDYIERNENHKTLSKEERPSLGQQSKGLTKKNTKNNETLKKNKNSSLEKRSRILSNGNVEIDKDDTQEKKSPSREVMNNRMKSHTRTISKSADFDKAKHRANMAKRYANKTWMKARQNTSTNAKMEENEISDNTNEKNTDYVQRNHDSRKKAVSKSAGSSTRKREDLQTEKTESKEANIIFTSDDTADPSKRTTKILEEHSSTNRTRITATPISKSFRQEDENNPRSSDRQSPSQSGIQRKDLEKLSAIFLSSTLKRNAKETISKLNNRNDRESRKERHKSVPTNRNRMEDTRLDRISSSRISNEINSKVPPSVSNLSKLPSKTEKWVKSKIPVAISRLKKELEEPRVQDSRDFSESPVRGSSSRTKSTMKESELTSKISKDERIDESTSVGIMSIDKSDFTKNESNERNEIRSRLDEWSKKLEETRRRERDVELKVLKMAKAQKEERKKEFEKRGFREVDKKLKSEGKKKEIVDVAAKMNESMGKKSHCASKYNDSRDVIDGGYVENDYGTCKESCSKLYSLRSSMYARYFPTAL